MGPARRSRRPVARRAIAVRREDGEDANTMRRGCATRRVFSLLSRAEAAAGIREGGREFQQSLPVPIKSAGRYRARRDCSLVPFSLSYHITRFSLRRAILTSVVVTRRQALSAPSWTFLEGGKLHTSTSTLGSCARGRKQAAFNADQPRG